jgi:hypothetical protein
VPGVLNVYPYTATLPGQVDVYVESSTDPDGIASPAQLAAVLAAIELDGGGLATRRPATALVNAFSISRRVFVVEVTGLAVSDAPTVQAQIDAAVADYFTQRAPYIVGLTVPPRTDRIVSSSVASIVDAIVSAAGGLFSGVVVKLSGAPITIYTLATGEKAKGSAVFL